MQTQPPTVFESMSLPVVTIGPEARTDDVLELARTKGVHHFPIVEQGKLVGIVCTCDLQQLSPEAKVMQVAWRYVVTLPPEAPLSDAARLMMMQGVGSIVVLGHGRVQGILTREDLIRDRPELDQVLWEARCTCCGSRRHLRPQSDGQCICLDCQSRARDGAWLDAGGEH